jgi:hypothetical protein
LAAIAYIAPLLLLRRRPDLLLWYLILVLPVCLVTAIDVVDHRLQTSITRYTQMAGPGLYVLIAAAFAEKRGHKAFPAAKWLMTPFLLPALAALACLLTVSGAYNSDTDSQFLADAVAPDARAGIPMVFARAGRPDWYAGALYLMLSHYTDVRGPIMLLTHPAPPDWTRQLPPRTPRLWLAAGAPIDRPDQLLPGVVFQAGPDDHLLFPNLKADLWRIDRPQPASVP